MSLGPFKVGDSVVWTSQAQGYTKAKHGVIVAMVPAGRSPIFSLPPGNSFSNAPGLARNHESYLVQVGSKVGLYWPRVSALHRMEGEQP